MKKTSCHGRSLPLALAVFLFLIASGIARSQHFVAGEFKGLVVDSISNTPLAKVLVCVRSTTKKEMSDKRGQYAVFAGKGDTLSFLLPGYALREIVIGKEMVGVVRLQPAVISTKPNVIFILADDLGWAETATYGSPYYKSPNIDRLAREGERFTNAYAAAPDCSPTRASIMTGKYPARLHLTDYIPGLPSPHRPLAIPKWQKFLPLEEYTLGELFRDNGYRTALFGKWHLSADKRPPKSLPYNPDKQGFEETMITYKPGRLTDAEYDPHNSDSITERSIRFLKEDKGKPFFLFMSFHAVHEPLMENSDSIAKWNRNPLSRHGENNPLLAAMLVRMDRGIGKVLGEVDSLGLKSNTIILFFSDNGGLEADALQTPLRRGKGWLYEGGIREPFIVRWPGVVPGGGVNDEPVCSVDFMPTFCEMLGTKCPANIDGTSLLSLLRYHKPLPPRNLYWHYPHYMDALAAVPCGALRSGKWKLIEWFEKSLLPGKGPAFELYDLEHDPGETVNLAPAMEELTGKLARELAKWRKNVGAQMPAPIQPKHS